MNVLSKFKISLAGLVASAILFTSCKKDDPDIQPTPAAGLIAFNLAPDQPAVAFTLSGNLFGSSTLGYNSYSGNYLPIFVGTRDVRTVDYSTGATLATSTKMFADSSWYSLFLIGNNGAYRNVIVEDNYDNVTPMAGKAWVRYVDAITDSAAAPTITIGSISETAAYGTVSDFKQVNAGTVSATLTGSSALSATRDLTLQENKIYTILLTGTPGATDTTKAVRIRYVEMGTATN